MKRAEYAVIVNVFAADIDEAAEVASEFLRTGGTPDAVLPTDKVELLISTIIESLA